MNTKNSSGNDGRMLKCNCIKKITAMKEIVKILSWLILLVVNISCLDHNKSEEKGDGNEVMPVDRIDIEETEELVIYYPHFTSVDLACGVMPEKKDSTVILCAEAAFTGELLKEFKHSNVAGNHTSGGKYYRGFTCRPNTGTFVWYEGKWKFLMKNHNEALKLAAQKGGMGFRQNMMIFNYKTQPSFRKLTSKFEYRALCEYKWKLCLIDSKRSIPYKKFLSLLENLKVKYALYMDMGSGWNYSWYRDDNGRVHQIHPRGHQYTTNWLVFRK